MILMDIIFKVLQAQALLHRQSQSISTTISTIPSLSVNLQSLDGDVCLDVEAVSPPFGGVSMLP